MSILENEIKDFFANLALIREALNEAEAEEMPAQDPAADAPRVGPSSGLSDAAHNSILAIAQHHYNKQANKEREAAELADPTTKTGDPYHHELPKAELRGHEDTVVQELIGTPDAPGPVAKMAKSLGKKFNMDPEDILSQFIAGGAKGKSLPILSLIKQHGHELLNNPEAVTPQSWKAKLRLSMQRTAMNAVKSRKRKKETDLYGSVPGEATSPYSSPEEKSEIKPEAQARGQREMGTFRSVAYNEDQKKLADLIKNYTDDQRVSHGEKGNAGGIHPDTLHDILHHHFFLGYGPDELVDKFGHLIPSKSANEDPAKVRTSKRKVMTKRLSDFKDNILAPHFDAGKPREPKPEEPQQAAGTGAPPPNAPPSPPAPNAEPQGQEEPDPMRDPRAYGEFKRASGAWKGKGGMRGPYSLASKFAKQTVRAGQNLKYMSPRKQPQVSPETSAATTRSATKLKTLRNQPQPDPNAEPEHPDAPGVEEHDTPRTPGLESVNITARLFGNGYANVVESVNQTGSLIKRRG